MAMTRTTAGTDLIRLRNLSAPRYAGSRRGVGKGTGELDRPVARAVAAPEAAMNARRPIGPRTTRRSGRTGGRTRTDGGAARGRAATDAATSRRGAADAPSASEARGAGTAARPSHAAPRAGSARAGAWQRLGELTPSLARAYEGLARAAAQTGPLDGRQSALVKVALSVGRGSWRGTHAHARKALESGVSAEALRQVACLALPVLGLAAALDALRWIEEIIEERGAPGA